MLPQSRGAEEIVAAEYVYDSAWHIHTALSWLDLGKRQRNSSALLYSGLQLRYGIELLWYELLFTSHPSITSEEYLRALSQTTTLYKLIDSYSPHYTRFVEFTRILLSLDSQPQPAIALWDMTRLKRIHGECSQKLLHLQGRPAKSFQNDQWFLDRVSFLDESCSFIWETMRREGKKVFFKPEGFKKPEVYELWEMFRDGRITEESVRTRLILAQPVLRSRP